MAHNFIEHLNLTLDPTGNTALGFGAFVSVDGNDSNNGADPNTPYKSIDAALTGIVIVLGEDQIYPDLPTGNKTYVGDGTPILDGQGIRGIQRGASGSGLTLENLIIQSFIASLGTNPNSFIGHNNGGQFIRNVVFRGNEQINWRCPLGAYSEATENVFYNQDFRLFTSSISASINPFNRCMFISDGIKRNVIFEYFTGADPAVSSTEWHSNVFVNQNIICDQAQIEKFNYCYFENCTFEVDGTVYNDTNVLKLAIPTALPNQVEGNASFRGDFSRGEYRSVSPASVLIANGKFSVNIGNVNEGLVFNSTNIQSSNNITFNNGAINLTDPLVNGQIIWQQSFSRVVTNPFLFLNGSPDYINNIIRAVQSPDPINPRKITVQIETRDKNQSFRPIKIYRSGYKIGEDANGLSSGDDDYHEFGQQELRVIEVRITMTVRA